MSANKRTNHQIIHFILASMVGICVFVFAKFYISLSLSSIIIQGLFLNDTIARFSAVNSDGSLRVVKEVQLQKTGRHTPATFHVGYHNLPIWQFQIDFFLDGEPVKKDGAHVSVQELTLSRIYGSNSHYVEGNLSQNFTYHQSGDQDERARIAGTEGANSIRSKHYTTNRNLVKPLLIALLFFLATYFVLRRSNASTLPAFADMSLGKEISSTHEFGIINGLRGLAAVLVLLSHTAPHFEALGVGLALLFVLSGFLLSKPFIVDPSRLLNKGNLEQYFVKRVKRILPMYYLFIFAAFIVSNNINEGMAHFLFLKSQAHLWPMTQIFAFYLLLPFILILASRFQKLHPLLPIVVLLAASYLWLHTMNDWKPFFNGVFYHEFHLYSFLIGVAAAYIQFGVIRSNSHVKDFCLKYRWPLSLLGLTILFFTIAWSAPLNPPSCLASFIQHYYFKSLLCVVIILFALNLEKTVLSALLNTWLLRSIGVVGFSFYILHGLGIQIATYIQTFYLGIQTTTVANNGLVVFVDRSWLLVGLAFAITYALSLLSYSFVERPFFGYRKK